MEEEVPVESTDDISHSDEGVVNTLTPLEMPAGIASPIKAENLDEDVPEETKEAEEASGEENIEDQESNDDEDEGEDENSDTDGEDEEKWRAELEAKQKEMENKKKVKRKKTPRFVKPQSARRATATPPSLEMLQQQAQKLKNEVLNLQNECQELETQKAVLDRNITQKEKLIRKTTNGIDKMLSNLKRFTKEVEVLERDVSDLRQENQTLAEMHSINMMTKERLQKLKETRGGRRKIRPLSIDRKAKLIALEDEIKLKDRDIRNLEEEIKLLDHQIERNENTVQNVEESIKEMHGQVEESYHAEARNTELDYQIQTLEKEIRTLQQINRMKSQTVAQLNIQLENWENLEEAYMDMKKFVATLDRDVKKLLFHVNQLDQQIERRDQELEHTIGNRDTIPVECLRDDQDFLKKQIETSQRKDREMDDLTRNEENNLQELQHRLRLIETAMKETGMNRKIARSKKKKHERQLLLNASLLEEEQIQKDERERRKRMEAAQDAFGVLDVEDSDDDEEEGDSDEENEDRDDEDNFNPEELIQESLFNLLEKEFEICERKRMEQMTLIVEKDSSIGLLKEAIEDLEMENVSSDKDIAKKLKKMGRKDDWLVKEIRNDEERFVREERNLRMQLVNLRRKASGSQFKKKRKR